MEGLGEAVLRIADSDAIVGGLALLSVAGVIPRVGLGRAVTLAFRSCFRKTYPLSVRKSEIDQLYNSIDSMEKGSYTIVTGSKGIGKSCLLDSCLNRDGGVVKIMTESGASKRDIMDQVLREITGLHFDFLKPTASARRVLFFYPWMFRRPPIVVIRVPEHQNGQPYVDLTSAVRDLAEDFGLRMIFDGSQNSVPPELFSTKRGTIVHVEPMSKEQIESIPEFKDLNDFLKTHHLHRSVWKVLGGSPADYLKLKEIVQRSSESDNHPEVIVEQVMNHLQSMLSDALNISILNSSVNTKQIIKIFRKKRIINIPKAELEAMGFLLDYPNNVFREVKTSDDWFVEPANSAIAFIISENIHDGAGIRSLNENLLRIKKKHGRERLQSTSRCFSKIIIHT